MPLDGELWLGRGHGRFDAVSALVRRRRPVEADWAQVVYLIFELPRGGGRFDERVARLVEIVAQHDWPQLVAVEQRRIESREALLQAVISSSLSRQVSKMTLRTMPSPTAFFTWATSFRMKS